jgi:hypothetical protein
MAKAELRLNIGADNSQAVKKIKEVKKEGVDAVQEIQNKNREALKGLLGRVSLVAIGIQALTTVVQKVGEAVKKYFAEGDAFREMAKGAKISAESVAYLKAQADSAGISTEEFEKALKDLADGNTTIDNLSNAWSRLGNSIDTAKNAQKNFEQLTRQLNFDEFDKKLSNISGSVANFWLELVGSHGKQKAIIQQAVYEGKTLAEAMEDAYTKIRRFESGATVEELRQWYYEAQAIANSDRIATQRRTINKTAKKLAESEMSAEDRERIFKETTGQAFSNDAIIALAEQIKTAEEKLAESIKEATEVEKKRLEEEKKKEAEAERVAEVARQEVENIEKETEDTIKKLAKANITDEERSRLLKERYDMDFTGKQIREWAAYLKTKSEILDDNLKGAEEKKKQEDDFITKIAKSELSSEEKERLVSEQLGKNLSAQEIMAIADSLKSFGDRAAEALSKAEKDAQERKKIDDEMSQIKSAIDDNFTAGGGLIGGVSYANVIGHDLRDVTKGIRDGINESKEQNKTLKKIETLLKD